MLRGDHRGHHQSVPHVLMDGVMTQHSISPGQGGAPSTLSVMGKDLTGVMDLQDFGGLPYPAMPIEARVALIVRQVRAVRHRSR